MYCYSVYKVIAGERWPVSVGVTPYFFGARTAIANTMKHYALANTMKYYAFPEMVSELRKDGFLLERTTLDTKGLMTERFESP